VPNGEALARWAKNHNVNLTEPEGLEAALNELESVINQYRQGGVYDDLFPSRWLPAAIAILNEPFNADNKQINSTGKMVRGKIVERYKDTIDYLYTPEAKNIVNQRNIDALKKILGVN
jgi:long-chain acyl-CoA synthetase